MWCVVRCGEVQDGTVQCVFGENYFALHRCLFILHLEMSKRNTPCTTCTTRFLFIRCQLRGTQTVRTRIILPLLLSKYNDELYI